eukprot:4546033-Amphidinium_carterae.1
MAYAADSLVAPVRKLQNVALKVACGKLNVRFSPSEIAPLRVPKPCVEPSLDVEMPSSSRRLDVPTHPEGPPQDEELGSSSESEGDVSSGEQTKQMVDEINKIAIDAPVTLDQRGLELWRHSRYGTHHWRRI